MKKLHVIYKPTEGYADLVFLDGTYTDYPLKTLLWQKGVGYRAAFVLSGNNLILQGGALQMMVL